MESKSESYSECGGGEDKSEWHIPNEIYRENRRLRVDAHVLSFPKKGV